MRFARPLVIALICVAFSPSVRSHVFDKTAIEIVGTGKTDTFTITDRSGCTARTDISIQDPTIAAVDPIKTGFVATFTYRVKALKTGTTTLLVRRGRLL